MGSLLLAPVLGAGGVILLGLSEPGRPYLAYLAAVILWPSFLVGLLGEFSFQNASDLVVFAAAEFVYFYVLLSLAAYLRRKWRGENSR